MAAWSVVMGTIVVVVIITTMLARQGSPWQMSDRAGVDRPDFTERPAGPDAEAMEVPDFAAGGDRARRPAHRGGTPP